MTWLDDWGIAGTLDSPSKKIVRKSKTKVKPYRRCWEDHKPIKLLNGEVLGAACGHPQPGYDVYIGFDYGMEFSKKNYPWYKKKRTVEFLYPIMDMCAPKDAKEFQQMIVWIAKQLEAGKKIQMGCVGGHGRTGMVLAALVAYLGLSGRNHNKWNAVQWVRKHHCKKAVESISQIKFLMKHYNVARVEPTKQVFGKVKQRSEHGNYSGVRYDL